MWEADVRRWRFYGIAVYEGAVITISVLLITTIAVILRTVSLKGAMFMLISPWHWMTFGALYTMHALQIAGTICNVLLMSSLWHHLNYVPGDHG